MSNLAVYFRLPAVVKKPLDFYQRVIELQPDNLVAINNLTWILCENQRNISRPLPWQIAPGESSG